MAFPLMPKATAAWLVDNTALTFDQIAEFCGLHPLEVQALADGEVNSGIMGTSPILNGELTQDEIDRCEKNTNAKLKMQRTDLPKPRARSKGPRYTPVTKRAEKPNAVAFLIKTYPMLADVQIAKLVGSTKPTVDAIRNKTHPQSSSMKPVDPVSIGLCTADELDKAVKKAQRRVEREKSGIAAPASFGNPFQKKSTAPVAVPAAAAEAADEDEDEEEVDADEDGLDETDDAELEETATGDDTAATGTH